MMYYCSVSNTDLCPLLKHSQYKLTTQFKADNILLCYKILYMFYMAQGNSPDTCPTAAFDDGFW